MAQPSVAEYNGRLGEPFSGEVLRDCTLLYLRKYGLSFISYVFKDLASARPRVSY